VAGFVLVEHMHRWALKRHRQVALEKEAAVAAPTTTVKAIRFKAFKKGKAAEPSKSELSNEEVRRKEKEIRCRLRPAARCEPLCVPWVVGLAHACSLTGAPECVCRRRTYQSLRSARGPIGMLCVRLGPLRAPGRLTTQWKRSGTRRFARPPPAGRKQLFLYADDPIQRLSDL
jgi:hypothetical protein